MQVFVIPPGCSSRIEGAIRRELDTIARRRQEPDTDWLFDESPERIVVIVDAADAVHDVVRQMTYAVKPAKRRGENAA